MEDEAQACFLEIPVAGGQPAFIKLAAGEYYISVIRGLRRAAASAGDDACEIVRLSMPGRMLFFWRKLLFALSTGVSFKILWKKAQMALGRATNFGAVAGPVQRVFASNLIVPGPVSSDDAVNYRVLARLNVEKRLRAMPVRPRFRIWCDPEEAGIALQTYPDIVHGGDGAGIDFDIYVTPGTVLAEDALMLMAEAIVSRTDVGVVYADEWVDGVPTAKFGPEALIYSSVSELGNVIGLRRDAFCPESPLPDDSAIVVRVAVPLAHAKKAACFQPAPRPDASEIRRAPEVSVIVPTRDRADLLSDCLEGLINSAGVRDIIVVDNGSVEPETFALFERMAQLGVRIVRDPGDFNFSRLCNLGACHASADMLAFVNNDIKVIHEDWLQKLSFWAAKDDIGAVGTRLYYGDDTLQHGGIALGMSGCAGHLFRGLARADCEAVPTLAHVSERMAVTAACLVVAARKFHAVEGFDADCFPVTLNDVDLCLRLREKGWATLYVPEGEAYHLESISRGEDVSPEKKARRAREIRAFRMRWRHLFETDMWMSSMLSLANETPRFR